MNQCVQMYCNDLSDEVRQQVQTIECSKRYTELIVIGILLTLYYMNLQENQVVCSAICGKTCACPQIFPIRVTSSILILIALVFFYNLSCETAQASCGTNCSANTSFTASVLTLTAALIRFNDLLCNFQR